MTFSAIAMPRLLVALGRAAYSDAPDGFLLEHGLFDCCTLPRKLFVEVLKSFLEIARALWHGILIAHCAT